MKKHVITALEAFQRQCLFCSDDIPSNAHKLRRYCVRKHGINDWCKHQFKKLAEQSVLAGEPVIRTLKDDPGEAPTTTREDLEKLDLTPKFPVAEKHMEGGQIKIEISLDPEKTPKLQKNKNVIEMFLGDKDEILVQLNQMITAKYDFSVYENRYEFPDPNTFYDEVGDYALAWYANDQILLTHTIKLSCL